MCNLNSILVTIVTISLLQLPHANASSLLPTANSITSYLGISHIGTSPWGWIHIIKVWFFGPDGTIAVQKVTQEQESSSNFFSLGESSSGSGGFFKVNMVPQWSIFSLAFPVNGMEGVLVKANPPDACINLEDAPRYDTPTGYLDEEDGNVSAMALVKNWFLLVEDGYCDYNTKIQNADWAGYTLLIIRQGRDSFDEFGNPLNSTFIDESDLSINIYTCTVEDMDGYRLEHYSYPAEYIALATDLRKWQWKRALLRLGFIGFGTTFVASGTGILINEYIKKLKKKKEARQKAALEKLEEARTDIVKTLPSKKWLPDAENMRTRCQWCHRRFDLNDDVTTLPCSHMFHKLCLVPRILRGHGYCPTCQERIHSPSPHTSGSTTPIPQHIRRKSTLREINPVFSMEGSSETTSLLSSVQESGNVKIKEGTITQHGQIKRYHCHICELLGLPLQEELELVDELARQVGTLRSRRYEFRIPSRHSSLDTSISTSIVDLAAADEELADAEVRRITSYSKSDILQKLRDDFHEKEDDDESPKPSGS